jgi:hypothetical protein
LFGKSRNGAERDSHKRRGEQLFHYLTLHRNYEIYFIANLSRTDYAASNFEDYRHDQGSAPRVALLTCDIQRQSTQTKTGASTVGQ